MTDTPPGPPVNRLAPAIYAFDVGDYFASPPEVRQEIDDWVLRLVDRGWPWRETINGTAFFTVRAIEWRGEAVRLETAFVSGGQIGYRWVSPPPEPLPPLSALRWAMGRDRAGAAQAIPPAYTRPTSGAYRHPRDGV